MTDVEVLVIRLSVLLMFLCSRKPANAQPTPCVDEFICIVLVNAVPCRFLQESYKRRCPVSCNLCPTTTAATTEITSTRPDSSTNSPVTKLTTIPAETTSSTLPEETTSSTLQEETISSTSQEETISSVTLAVTNSTTAVPIATSATSSPLTTAKQTTNVDSMSNVQTSASPLQNLDSSFVKSLIAEHRFVELYRAMGYEDLAVEMSGFRGFRQAGASIFLGVPYAQAPVGPLRFQKPVPYKNVGSAIRNATTPGHACPGLQKDNSYAYDEDCLNINIFIPARDPSEHHPLFSVMIYIHGGSLTKGSNMEFDAHHLAVQANAIIVTINYRLGIFGFSASDDGSIQGNLGFYDQRLAMQWVKINIRKFGGNPDSITLVGGGSISVAAQLLSPLNNATLFQRAIIVNGCPKLYSFHTNEADHNSFGHFLELSGCVNLTHSECLRSKTTDEIVEMNRQISSERDFHFPFEANFGEDFLPGPPSLIGQWASNLNQYSVMIGIDETAVYNNFQELAKYENLSSIIDKLFAPESTNSSSYNLIKEIIEFRYRQFEGDSSLVTQLHEILEFVMDFLYGIPAITFAEMLKSFPLPTYLFRLAHPARHGCDCVTQTSRDLQIGTKVMSITQMLFGLPSLANGFSNHGEKVVSQNVINLLANFAHTGDPNNSSQMGSGIRATTWHTYSNDMGMFNVRDHTQSDQVYARSRELWTNLIPKILGKQSTPVCETNCITKNKPTAVDCHSFHVGSARLKEWKESYEKWFVQYQDWKKAFNRYETLTDEI